MPYAAKAIVEHEYLASHLNLYLTFKSPMRLSAIPRTTPPVFNWYPPVSLWILKADSVTYTITSCLWLDNYTLKLISNTITTRPAIVTLEYDGPNEKLETAWHKQYSPFGPIPSTDKTGLLLPVGMIVLWSGSIATIPSGWALCDGTNGTPNLKNKFIVCAGDTYAVAATGGALTHTHAATQPAHSHGFSGGGPIQSGSGLVLSATTPTITVPSVNHLPPYYALAYIMKL